MTDYPPPQYPDQNPASGWPPPAQPGPEDQREQSSTPSDQTWYSAEPPTTIAPVPPTAPPQAYPASPPYGQATPAYPPSQPAPAYPPSQPAYPGSPAASGYPADPYTVPADPYPTTPYPPAPAPAGYPYGQASVPPYGQTSAPPYGQPSGPPYGQVMQPMAVVVAPPSSGAALASMILGIVGLVFGCFLCGIPSVLAIIFGHIGLNQTKNDVKSGRGLAIAGLVMGYVLIIPTIIGTIFFLGWLGVVGSTAASTGTSGY